MFSQVQKTGVNMSDNLKNVDNIKHYHIITVVRKNGMPSQVQRTWDEHQKLSYSFFHLAEHIFKYHS